MSTEKYPLIYSTDLFYPPRDPDDHFDLATLFSLPELEILGIILDQGGRQKENKPGIIPVEQMIHITGQKVPHAVGLNNPLKFAKDKGFGQNEASQKAIEMILEALKNTSKKVTIFTVGSLRDTAVAFNRNPSLFREKVKRIYVNAGYFGDADKMGLGKNFTEYNVAIDKYAFLTIMRSGLPIYWCPCFGEEYGTFWKFLQRKILETLSLALQNYFFFALTKPKRIDPIDALSMQLNPDEKNRIWSEYRNMWCTAPFIHAAKRKVYKLADGRYAALRVPPQDAEKIQLFEFIPAFVSVDNNFKIKVILGEGKVNMHVFHLLNKAEYSKILASCLRELLKSLGQ